LNLCNRISLMLAHCIRLSFIHKTEVKGNRIKRGLKFGLVAWALMVPWFEFYLPWNVMHEPLLPVLLEMILWLGVLLSVGLAIAGVYEWKQKV
jgi:hypothetical protein